MLDEIQQYEIKLQQNDDIADCLEIITFTVVVMVIVDDDEYFDLEIDVEVIMYGLVVKSDEMDDFEYCDIDDDEVECRLIILDDTEGTDDDTDNIDAELMLQIVDDDEVVGLVIIREIIVTNDEMEQQIYATLLTEVSDLLLPLDEIVAMYVEICAYIDLQATEHLLL